MEKYIYVCIFLMFLPLFFFILRASELEKHFKQGKVFEIRLAYILFSMILSFLATKSIELLFSWF